MDRKRRMGRAGYGWRERRRFPRREGTHPRATSLTRIVADRVQRCKESRSPRLSEQSFPRIECRRRTLSLTTSTQSSPTREDATMSNLPPEYLRASVRKQLRPSGSDHRPTERPLRPPKGCRHPGRREWRSVPVSSGNRRSGSQLIPNLSTLVSGNENSWDSGRREGRKSLPRFSPGDAGVESTAPNFVQPLRKRVADMKHGFESRWGHHSR